MTQQADLKSVLDNVVSAYIAHGVPTEKSFEIIDAIYSNTPLTEWTKRDILPMNTTNCQDLDKLLKLSGINPDEISASDLFNLINKLTTPTSSIPSTIDVTPTGGEGEGTPSESK